jgi:flagellar FliJ protein
MTKSERFEPIRAVASNSAQALSAAVGEAGRRVAEIERQIAQLQTYRDDYVRNSADAGGTMDTVRFQNYRSFLERLGEALRAQAQALAAARAEYDRRHAVWREKRIEAESLGRAVDRFRQEEQRAADRGEQREADEAALRMSLAGRQPPGT